MPERSLVEFVTELQGESHLRIEHDFGDGFVRLHTSEAERRQAAQDIQCSEDIVLELLRNARDAHASQVFLAISREGDRRTIVVIDDGDGIPASMHDKIFLPRVTSKLDTSHMDAWGLHGRGMALYSISENSLESRVVDSQVDLGTSISVTTNLAKLPEKKDQSSFPRFIMGEEGTVAVRGPKNVLRTSCEFAIEARNDCAVHFGSPAEIAACLYSYGRATLSAVDRAFCKDIRSIPLVKRLAVVSDPQEFAEQSALLGLPLSQRTARRILDGEISDTPSLLEQVVIERKGTTKRGGKPSQRRRPKMQKEDTDTLRNAVKSAYAPLAEQYYLDDAVEPFVRISPDKITITVPLVEKP